MPDPTFAKLYQATATVAAPPLTDIQTHARRRARRQRLLAGGTALTVGVVVASGAAFAAGRLPDPGPVAPNSGATSTPPSPVESSSPAPGSEPSTTGSAPSRTDSARPQPTTVPTSVMLRPEDVDEYHPTVDDDPQVGDWSIDFILRFCPARQGTQPPTSTPIDSRHRALETVSGAPQALDARAVVQRVDLHTSTSQAVAWFEYFRNGVTGCGRFMAGPDNEITVTVLAQNIAGDRSMIVRVTSSAAGTTTYAFVAVGRWFTEFTIPERAESEFRRIVRQAASRLGR